MRSYNSYENYRQYRKNRRGYEAEVGTIPALILVIILLKTVSLIKVLFIMLAVVLIVVACYKYIKNCSEKVTKIDLDSMNDEMFSIYCGKLLSLNQFKNVRAVSGGIDVIGEKDGFTYGVKCIIKPNKITVDADTIRTALGGSKYYYCDKTIIITNRSYALNATKLAQDLNVILWNREELIKLLQNDPCATVSSVK